MRPRGEGREVESLMLESEDGLIWRKRAVFQEIRGDETAFLFEPDGTIIGIGDFRQEKGKGSNGCFTVMGGDETSPLWDALMKEGREAQQAAYDNPVAADMDTEELLQFYREEVLRRAA